MFELSYFNCFDGGQLHSEKKQLWGAQGQPVGRKTYWVYMNDRDAVGELEVVQY